MAPKPWEARGEMVIRRVKGVTGIISWEVKRQVNERTTVIKRSKDKEKIIKVKHVGFQNVGRLETGDYIPERRISVGGTNGGES